MAVGHILERGPPSTILAKFVLIWFSGFIWEDLHVKVYDGHQLMAKAPMALELKTWKNNKNSDSVLIAKIDVYPYNNKDQSHICSRLPF